MRIRWCTICGEKVPEKRIIERDAVTCSNECYEKHTRFLGWILEQMAGAK